MVRPSIVDTRVAKGQIAGRKLDSMAIDVKPKQNVLYQRQMQHVGIVLRPHGLFVPVPNGVHGRHQEGSCTARRVNDLEVGKRIDVRPVG